MNQNSILPNKVLNKNIVSFKLKGVFIFCILHYIYIYMKSGPGPILLYKHSTSSYEIGFDDSDWNDWPF